MKKLVIATFLAIAAITPGCKDDDNAGADGPLQGSSSADNGNAQAAPAAEPAPDQHNRVPLGEMTVRGLKLVATMDEPVKPGGEGAFDLVITGGKPRAVRFWVGTEDAEGSVKSRAEEETTDNWHAHAEVPNPLPSGGRFWAEIEPTTGEPFKVSFDLKVQQ